LNTKYSKHVQSNTGPDGVGVGVGHVGQYPSSHEDCSVKTTPTPE